MRIVKRENSLHEREGVGGRSFPLSSVQIEIALRELMTHDSIVSSSEPRLSFSILTVKTAP